VKDQIVQALSHSTGLTQAQLSEILIEPKELRYGDFSFPCYVLAKQWGIAPPECAKKLEQMLKPPPQVERSEAAGPYLNFFLKRAPQVERVIKEILTRREAIGSEQNSEHTIIIEYSSPNIAKPFHVGHLRTTVIGHALDRIYRHLGYRVISINHLGDWGTQFGFVWVGCELWGRPQNATVFDLVAYYTKAANLRKAQEKGEVPPEDAKYPDVNQMAREYFRKLEAGEKTAVDFWQWCLNISLDYLRNLYKRLGIHFDFYTGESFYRDQLKKTEQELRESGILEESRGAWGVNLGDKLGYVRLFTEDGRSLYITRDITAADYRYRTFNPLKILYVVGAPQKLHFQQLIGILKKMKHPAAERIVHVAYGNVPHVSTRTSSGAAERIWLHTLLEEAHERALHAYRHQVEKRPENLDEQAVAEAVGLGAIFFNYLSRSNVKEFNFTWEEALNFQGDTGPYVQYALARINSIQAKAANEGLPQPSAEINAELLTDDNAYSIVSLLSRFHATIRRAAEEYEPYHIALYVLELARTFSAAYKSLRVVGQEPELAKARLALFTAVKYVLQRGLNLIGVPPVERM